MYYSAPGFEFTNPRSLSKATSSCFLHGLQVLLNHSRGSGALELAHIARRKTLAGRLSFRSPQIVLGFTVLGGSAVKAKKRCCEEYV